MQVTAIVPGGSKYSLILHAGDKEKSWTEAGLKVGLQIWRIEKFAVVAWPADRYGLFYTGDSYMILHTYKKKPESKALSFDLHFWLGENTSQDEAGTAAYKTVELDDRAFGTTYSTIHSFDELCLVDLGGRPVQYREVQGYESSRFLSYFPRFICLHGGVSTGFHHVSARPVQNLHKLYRINLSRQIGGRSHLQVREVLAEAASLVEGDVFVLDKGKTILQFNTKDSVGQEKFKAAEFVQSLVTDREGQSEVKVFGKLYLGSTCTL
jgi:gelsolin